MRLLISKKGIEKETFVLLTMTVAIVFVSFFLIKNSSIASESLADVAACKASVERNAQLRINGIEFPTSIHCPARSLAIKDTATANEMIAKEMYYCWDQYGEGKLNLFKDEATFCAVCSFIHVQTDEAVVGLPDYLMREQIPDGSGRLYYTYLSGFQTDRAKEVLGSALKNPKLVDAATTSQMKKGDYAIVFVYPKGEDELEELKEHMLLETFAGDVGFVVGVGGGVIAGGGTMVALATIGIAGGPPGWVILGAGAVAFGVTFAISEGVSFISSSNNIPEWASFIVLRKWGEAETANVLTDGLGCDYFPVPLE